MRRASERTLVALEGDLHAHLRQDARVEFFESDAHLDRGLLAVGGGDDGDDLAGDFPIRIGVERGFDRLAGFDAVDETLADIDLDFQRSHVHQRANAGAREATARGHRGDHFAGLRILGGDDPGEGRADDGVVELLFPLIHLALGDDDVGPLAFEFRVLGVGLGLGLAEIGTAYRALAIRRS